MFNDTYPGLDSVNNVKSGLLLLNKFNCRNMKYIELFAGCGGLSLGLESIGGELLFANELSPMASETFAYNLLGEDLSKLAKLGEAPKKVKWITSKHSVQELDKRLRENLLEAPSYPKSKGDLNKDMSLSDLEGNLLVGSIVELNRYLSSNKKLTNELCLSDIDLVSGGPPCQSFSMAGLRDHNNARNTLPMEFVEFVAHVRPKIALLENVSGILRAFNLPDGKHFAWFEVAKAFVSKEYYPLCLHVNAKYTSAAQNRPRFIMIAMREDVFRSLIELTNEDVINQSLLEISRFYTNEINRVETQPFIDLNYYDIEKCVDFFSTSLFKSLNKCSSKKLYTVYEAIDDLRENNANKIESRYTRLLKRTFPRRKFNGVKHKSSNNGELRRNGTKVQMRFKLYQYLAVAKSSEDLAFIEREVLKFLQDPVENWISDDALNFLLQKRFLADDGKTFISLQNRGELEKYLSRLVTKKHSQRALLPHKPAPATLSIPDDACHYHEDLLRTLTVRELARFQSFPDWFEFRSKVTTGGQMRRFEVPQYTQVGNAVPPLLGVALGEVILAILSTVS